VTLGTGLSVSLCMWPLSLEAQGDVEPVTDYYATYNFLSDIDSNVLSICWTPSVTGSVVGYHICSGRADYSNDPCLSLDTVEGRDTGRADFLISDDGVRRYYGIYAFDSAGNASARTPRFSPVQLRAEIPECGDTVRLSWTPYEGMPGGVQGYALFMTDSCMGYSEVIEIYNTGADGPCAYTVDMSEYPDFRCPWFFVTATGNGTSGYPLLSTSRARGVKMRTADTAAFFAIDTLVADSLHSAVHLLLRTDIAFHGGRYTLWRSVDGLPWNPIAELTPTEPVIEYIDANLRSFSGSTLCYQLSVVDACGRNPRYTRASCVALPEPPTPDFYCPNTIVAGDSGVNGVFLPVVVGPMGDIYELNVYDQRGRLIYHTEDPEAGWHPDDSIHQGAYAYSLRVRFIDNLIHTYTGTVTVIK
jgi:hypothetical protein